MCEVVSIERCLCVRVCRPHQFAVGDGATTETGKPPTSQTTAQRSLPHAEAPDACPPPDGKPLPSLGGGVDSYPILILQEVELQARRDQFQLEELRQKQLLEKRQLPKRLKADHKQKIAEARKALRNKKVEKDSLKKLDEQYVQLCQLETELMNDRHEKEMETLRAELEANMRELQEIQVSGMHLSSPLSLMAVFPGVCRMRRRCS